MVVVGGEKSTSYLEDLYFRIRAKRRKDGSSDGDGLGCLGRALCRGLCVIYALTCLQLRSNPTQLMRLIDYAMRGGFIKGPTRSFAQDEASTRETANKWRVRKGVKIRRGLRD